MATENSLQSVLTGRGGGGNNIFTDKQLQILQTIAPQANTDLGKNIIQSIFGQVLQPDTKDQDFDDEITNMIFQRLGSDPNTSIKTLAGLRGKSPDEAISTLTSLITNALQQQKDAEVSELVELGDTERAQMIDNLTPDQFGQFQEKAGEVNPLSDIFDILSARGQDVNGLGEELKFAFDPQGVQKVRESRDQDILSQILNK